MFGWAWCLVMAQIQFSLIKKIRIGRPKHSLIPQPHTSDNISFLSTHHWKWTSYVYHTLSVKQQRVNQPSRPLKKWGPPIWSVFAIGVSGMDLEPKANIKYSLPITVLCALSLSPFRILNCRSNIFWQVISSK